MRLKKRANHSYTVSNKKGKADPVSQADCVSYLKFMSDFLASYTTDSTPNPASFLNSYFAVTPSRVLQWGPNNRTVKISLEESYKTKYSYKIIVEDHALSTPLLVTSVDESHNELKVKQAYTNELWSKNNIQDLIGGINFLVKANITFSRETLRYNDVADFTVDIYNPLNWFDTPQEFSGLVSRYKDQVSKIPQFLTYHTQAIDHRRVFWLSYPTKLNHQNFSLEVSIEPVSFKENPVKTDYHSWIFSEKEFLKLHGYNIEPYTQKYFRVTFAECLTNKEGKIMKSSQKPVLDAWFSIDSCFGELRNIDKGNILSGDEIMEAFGYIDQLLCIENLYLCDASRANKNAEASPGQIVFRVLMSVAYGKPWYERKFNYKAFSFQSLQHGWPGNHATLSQDAPKYEEARRQLQAYPVAQLEAIFKQEESTLPSRKDPDGKQKSQMLNYLCTKYDPSNSDLTLGTLTAKVYDQAKLNREKRDNKNDLQQMYEILTLPSHLIEPESKDAPPTFYQLLNKVVYTQFFRKQAKVSEVKEECPRAAMDLRS